MINKSAIISLLMPALALLLSPRCCSAYHAAPRSLSLLAFRQQQQRQRHSIIQPPTPSSFVPTSTSIRGKASSHDSRYHDNATNSNINIVIGDSKNNTDNKSGSENTTMPRGIKKENLPSKVCVVCERPFTWRKKWERVWDEVTTCSKSCNRKRKLLKNNDNGGGGRDSSTIKTSGNGDDGSADEAAPVVVEDAGFDTDALAVASHSGSRINRDEDFAHVDAEREDANAAAEKILADATIISALEDIRLDRADDESRSSQKSTTTENNEQFPPELIMPAPSPIPLDAKAQRKAEKKLKKAERRAQREGRGDPTAGQKQCTVCSKSVNLLIRCTYDESGEWGMVCGKCWNDVSGGVVDGDKSHPHYRYGGLWKNRRAQTP